MPLLRLPLLLVLLAAPALGQTVSAAGGAPPVLEGAGAAVLVHAVPDRFQKPVYPIEAIRTGREGWVDFRFTVKPDGSVADLEVIDASGRDEFERSATQAMRHAVFKPATLDGLPVEQPNVQFRMVFRLADRGLGARREFVRKLRQVDGLLDGGKLDEAREMLGTLDRGGVTLYEYAYLFTRFARYHAMRDEPSKALAYLRRSTRHKAAIERDFYPDLLAQQLRLELATRRYGDAFLTHGRLLEAGGTVPDELQGAVAKLLALRDGARPLLIAGVLEEACREEGACPAGRASWSYAPMRRTISLEPTGGALDRISVRCEKKTLTAKAEAGVTWTIPPAWGRCWAEVWGEPGATFVLIEE
ncbi:MAG TPA: TonB family protein [Azospirillaceae bacterium]|nr:TonB family protein [Azospirillaceae bacterium]